MADALTVFTEILEECGLSGVVKEYILQGLTDEHLVVLFDEPDHYVTFTNDKGWFIEHSIGCRVAGTLGTCAYNKAILMVTSAIDEPEDDLLGRWRITDVDSEGLPALERAP